jgi:hypothetical protein
MSNLWARDDRIQDDTSMRDLEKKIHFCMAQMCNAGIITTRGGNQMDQVPDDINADSDQIVAQIPSGI